MIGLPTVTGEGRLVDDPELRFTPSGHAVAKFKLAFNGRRFDKTQNKWVESSTTYLTANAWRDLAENVCESFRKGDPLVVTGHLLQREWEDREGNKRTSYDLEVEHVGASVKFATATLARTTRSTSDTTDAGDDPWAKS